MMHTRILVFAAVICLVMAAIPGRLPQGKASCCALVSASPSVQDWQRYTVAGEEFSVSLPVLPAMNTRKIFLERFRKSRTERELGAYWNGIVYSIQTFENYPRQSLDEFIAKRHSGINNPTQISINGFAGKQFEFTTRDLKGATQFFETQNHIYDFGVLGAPIDDPRVKEFFTSIILGGNRQGKEIQDGIGAVFSTDNSGGEPEQIYVGKDVDRKALIVMRPEPSYTESARQGKITGSVVLKTVFAANGAVTNIRVVSDLPFGLTERAITAAKQIRFIPAVKNGQFVSMWIQLEYNFNLY